MYHRTEATITMATKQITPTTKVSDEVEKQETLEVEAVDNSYSNQATEPHFNHIG